MLLKTLLLASGPIFVLSPYIFGRLQVATTIFFTNHLSRLQHVNAFSSYEIKFTDHIRNCEDVDLIETKGVAILACDPGRDKYNTVMGIYRPGSLPKAKLWAYDYAKDSKDTTALKEVDLVDFDGDFHTLGVAYHEPSSTLFVVNHSNNGSRIEAFTLDLAARQPVARHKRTIKHPLIHTPNSLAVINENEFYVTNDHHFLTREHRLLAVVETYLAIPGGSVVHVNLATDTYRKVARLPFANGVGFVNSTTLAVASSSKTAVYLYDVNPATRDLSFRSLVRVPFAPDNLRTDKNGKLLIAGHPHLPSLDKWATTRALCNSEEGKDAEVCKSIVSPSSIAEWAGEGRLRLLYTGTEYATGATAVRDVGRNVGIMVGLYAHGILVFKE
ncbi:hypothetical protein VTO42DRAFT_2981 [Malbranchea cinnamomea]